MNRGWCVIENIAWCGAFVACLFFLDGYWRFMCILPLAFVNTKGY